MHRRNSAKHRFGEHQHQIEFIQRQSKRNKKKKQSCCNLLKFQKIKKIKLRFLDLEHLHIQHNATLEERCGHSDDTSTRYRSRRDHSLQSDHVGDMPSRGVHKHGDHHHHHFQSDDSAYLHQTHHESVANADRAQEEALGQVVGQLDRSRAPQRDLLDGQRHAAQGRHRHLQVVVQVDEEGVRAKDSIR